MEKTKAKPKPKTAEKKQLTISLPKLNLKPGPMALLVVMTIVFFFVGTRFNGLVAIAKVGKTPIFAWELAATTWQKYRAYALTDLVREELVEQTAKKMNLTVTQEEVNEQASLIAENFGGEAALIELLERQGVSYEDQLNDIRLGLLARQIVEAQIEVKETEIDALIRDYGENLLATDSAGKREEAREILEDQKVSELYQTIFDDLGAEVGVDYYVNYGQ